MKGEPMKHISATTIRGFAFGGMAATLSTAAHNPAWPAFALFCVLIFGIGVGLGDWRREK